jgi:8-oxo-dGTP diphosphatase
MIREFASGGIVFRKFQIPNFKFQTNKFDSVKLNKFVSCEIKWLVAKSAKSKLYPESYWRLPKGWLDDEDGGKSPGPITRVEKKATEEELQKGALREVEEEGGVKAKIISKLGTDKFFFTSSGERILKIVTYFLMEWTRDLPEGFGFETSEVAWLGYAEARKRLEHNGEKNILDKAKKILDSGNQESLV